MLAPVSSAARQTASAWDLEAACLHVKYRTFRSLSVRLLQQTTLLLQVRKIAMSHLVKQGLCKVKNDHRSKFSNLSNWKEEA